MNPKISYLTNIRGQEDVTNTINGDNQKSIPYSLDLKQKCFIH